MKELSIKEKIEYIIELTEKYNITSYEISQNTSLSVMGVHNILSGSSKNPRDKTLNIIIDYLTRDDTQSPGMLGDTQTKYHKIRPELNQTPKASAETGVPYYNVDFSSGYDLFENNQTTNPNFYIDYAPYNHADLWINNVGNSMSPKIENGDIVALQQKNDLNQMLYGEIYAVVFPEIRTIKYIRKSEKDDHILLVPHDLINYDEQDMPKKLIKSFFLVLGSIKKFF